MAYTINSGAVVSCNLVGRCFGQRVIFTTHYQYNGAALADGHTTLSLIREFLDQADGVAASYANVTPEDLIGLEWHLQWIDPLRYRKRVIPSTHSSGASTTAETVNLAAVLSIWGDVATRRGQSNKHILCPQAPVVDGVFDGGYKSNVALLGAAMDDSFGLITGTVDPIIYGRAKAAYTKCGVVHPAQPRSVVRITGSQAQGTVRVMRRRTVGVGD